MRFNPPTIEQDMASHIFPHTFPIVGILILRNYVQLQLCISYEHSDLYMLVTTKALLSATSRAQVNSNRVQLNLCWIASSKKSSVATKLWILYFTTISQNISDNPRNTQILLTYQNVEAILVLFTLLPVKLHNLVIF